MPEHTPETVGQDAGRAIADSIIDAMESSVLGLANAIRAVQEDQAEAREEMHALLQRLDALERVVKVRTRHLG